MEDPARSGPAFDFCSFLQEVVRCSKERCRRRFRRNAGWYLSGYVLSRMAPKLLVLLPCRGPFDLWINTVRRYYCGSAPSSGLDQRLDPFANSVLDTSYAEPNWCTVTSVCSLPSRPVMFCVRLWRSRPACHLYVALRLLALDAVCLDDIPDCECRRLWPVLPVASSMPMSIASLKHLGHSRLVAACSHLVGALSAIVRTLTPWNKRTLSICAVKMLPWPGFAST